MDARAVIDIHDGHVRRRIVIARWPVHIGRALDNDIVLDDPHVAARHVTLTEADAGLGVEVGNTVNGIRIGHKRLARGQTGVWPPQTTLALGRCSLRARLAATPLADELPLNGVGSALFTAALGAATLAALAMEAWLGLDDSRAWWRTLLPILIGSVFLLTLWTAGWSLVSKVFSRQTDSARHLRTLFAGALVFMAGSEALALAAFAFDWPLLDRYASLFDFGVFAGLVYAHLAIVTNSRPWLRLLAVVAPTLVAVAMVMLVRLNETGRVADAPYLTTLFPPAFRLAPAQPLASFFDRAAALKARLDAEAADPAEADREYQR